MSGLQFGGVAWCGGQCGESAFYSYDVSMALKSSVLSWKCSRRAFIEQLSTWWRSTIIMVIFISVLQDIVTSLACWTVMYRFRNDGTYMEKFVDWVVMPRTQYSLIMDETMKETCIISLVFRKLWHYIRLPEGEVKKLQHNDRWHHPPATMMSLIMPKKQSHWPIPTAPSLLCANIIMKDTLKTLRAYVHGSVINHCHHLKRVWFDDTSYRKINLFGSLQPYGRLLGVTGSIGAECICDLIYIRHPVYTGRMQ